jgi:hypothetical protein
MITILEDSSLAPARWSDLADELDCWGVQGRIATLWWRDDDAVAPSRRLDDLLTVAGNTPVALAVIPGLAEPALAGWLERQAPRSLRVLQHGWRHVNHGVARKSEFPPEREPQQVAADLILGHARLREMFADRALAVLVPPWNRFEDALLPQLVKTGIAAISRLKPRRAVFAHPAVVAANVHVDLVDWRADRTFVGEAAALAAVVDHLRARREGLVDPAEATGILTHHLVQDEATGIFLGRLIGLTRGHAAAAWLDAEAVFAAAGADMSARGPR